MSEYIRYKGKIKPIGNVLDLEEFAEKYLRESIGSERYLELESYYDTNVEFLVEQCDYKFMVNKDVLYEIIERESLQYEDDVFEATELSDKTVEFLVMYYNGGCGFTEAIGEALDKIY